MQQIYCANNAEKRFNLVLLSTRASTRSVLPISQWNAHEQISAENWTKSADQAFDTACKQAREEGKMIAGFKLMYDQVKGPGRTVNGTNLPDGWFQEYLKARKVRIVHLVREGVILHMASDYQTAVDVNKLNLVGANSHHTMDPQLAAARRNATMFRFTARELPVLQSRENEHKHWLYFLRQTGLRYQYLSYEDLMSNRRDIFVHMVLQFLGVKDMVSYPKLQGQFLRIHKVACEDRIADFNAVEQLIRGTMSERACKMLSHHQQTVDRHVVPDDGSPACNKFIVLTTQRSGSTWFC